MKPSITDSSPAAIPRATVAGLLPALWAIAAWGLLHAGAAEPVVWRAELVSPARTERWRPLHDVASVESTPLGLRIAISGADPYIEGPAVDFPEGQRLLAKFRLRSDVGGAGQLFYYDEHATEERSVRFPVPAARWHDVVLALPPLGRRHRFRFDPPGEDGICLLADFRVTRPLAANFPEHQRPAPTVFPFPDASEPAGRDALSDGRVLHSGPVTLRHAPRRWHDFRLTLGRRVVAKSHDDPRIAYALAGTVYWWRLASDPRFETTTAMLDGRLRVVGEGVDPHGGRWRFEQTFVADGRGGFDTETRIVVDQERSLVYLPSLAVVAAPPDTARTVSRQALLAGVEYLDNEPSSSEKDIAGPAAQRTVPAPHKPTFPLMAIQAEGVCVSLSWQRQAALAPLFDWPDRLFGTGGGVMALIAPGAEPTIRQDGAPLPHSAWPLAARAVLTHRGHLRVEPAETVVAAVKAFVERRGLPPLPLRPTLEAYAAQAAAGWLDGPLRDGARYRHAVGNDFPAQPAFDVAWMLDALAGTPATSAQRAARRAAAEEAAGAVAAGQEFFAQVGHLQLPLAGLARGRFPEIQPQAVALARQLLEPPQSVFDADGVARYRPPAQGIDYSRTHHSREANGFAALPVLRSLQAALHAGDRELVRGALERLRRLERFRGGVPRGAQTWEIPLHTPDILAAAHLVKAYVLGYRVTGDPRFLELAREWAWTGVPFIYLDPLEGSGGETAAVGPYATIAVLGATQWKAPVWIGLPVQWCGLVYADALRWLQPHDRAGPWERLADGITLAAIQQCYPLGHPRAGLLPDSFDLVLQSRNPADINPGTLQPLALELLAGHRPHDLWSPSFLHTPLDTKRPAIVEGQSVWVTAAGRIRGIDPEPKPASPKTASPEPASSEPASSEPASSKPASPKTASPKTASPKTAAGSAVPARAPNGTEPATAAKPLRADHLTFMVEPWRVDGSHVVVHGAPWPAEVRVNGLPVVAERLEYLPRTRSLVIALRDATPARIEIAERAE